MQKQDYFKHFLKYPISRTSRKFIRQYRKDKELEVFLIMTLVVKNEEDILEKNIRFHKAMGVDGFIVTSHNSTDKTNEILARLKKEGLVFEIIYKNTRGHEHHIWVNDMVSIAKEKYRATWVINADADEFYYSKFLNLKLNIIQAIKNGLNVLIVDSTFLFPTDEADFVRDSHYFVTKPFQQFEADSLGIIDDKNLLYLLVRKDAPKHYTIPKILSVPQMEIIRF